ncbi:MAG: hypothetical protein LBJ71_00905 [Holosporaceae bacterium]|jgi:hypothetical protein|nr:hypothetical protein [Holosporaceae bacterium]
MKEDIGQRGISYVTLFSLLSLISICVLWEANWVFHNIISGDDFQFLTTTAIGKASHANTWGARFWPLGLSDYSILLLLPHGNTAFGHYAYTCIMMVFSSVMLFAFLNKVTHSRIVPLLSMLILFSASGFLQVHMNCFYSERMLFFMLSAFMICRYKAQAKQSIIYYVLAFLSAVYATYLKEPAFGAVAIIAIIGLLFGQLSKKDRIFNYSLLINSAIFIAIYLYRLMFKHHDKIYATIKSNVLDSASNQFQSEPLLFFIICLTIIRAYNILLKKDRKHIATDSLLFAGCGYAFAFTLLSLASNYYLIPAIVLFLPALAVFLSNSRKPIFYASISALAICAWNSVNYSKNLVTSVWEHRKNDHLFFEYLVDECKSGKKLYWLSDHWLEAHEPGYSHFDGIMCWDRYQHFINYYSDFTYKCKRVFVFDEFNKDSLIICSAYTVRSHLFPQIYNKLKELEFKKVKEFNGSSGAIVFAY